MKKLVIGVDIGGINTVLGLVDRTGEVYARSSFRTAEYPFFDDYSAYVEMLVRTLRELAQKKRIVHLYHNYLEPCCEEHLLSSRTFQNLFL